MRAEDSYFRYCAPPLHNTSDVRITGTLGYTDSAQKLKTLCEQRISVFPEFFLRIWGAQQKGVVLTDEYLWNIFLAYLNVGLHRAACCMLKEATELNIKH